MTKEPWTGSLVAITLMLLLGGALFALFRVQVPSGNHDVLLVVIGVLTSCVQSVVGYFFGSSVTSKKPTEPTAVAVVNNGGNTP